MLYGYLGYRNCFSRETYDEHLCSDLSKIRAAEKRANMNMN